MRTKQHARRAALVAALVAFLVAAGLSAGKPTVCKPCSVETIEAAMVRLKQPYTDDPVIADPPFRRTIATAIRGAADEWNQPALFLTGLFFRESSFRQAVLEGRRVGRLGERGLGQVHGVAKWWCTRRGYDLRTVDGQARCAAGWLDRCRRECDGSLEQGFARYATGRSCSPRFAGDVHRDRFALWRALEEGGPIPRPPRGR